MTEHSEDAHWELSSVSRFFALFQMLQETWSFESYGGLIGSNSHGNVNLCLQN